MKKSNVKVNMEKIRESKSKWKERVKRKMGKTMKRRVEKEKNKRKMRFIKEYGAGLVVNGVRSHAHASTHAIS